MPQTDPTPKRRWFEFSLGTLLIVVVLLSVGLGWHAWETRKAERQRQAVEARQEAERPIRETVNAIREAGGSVRYDRGNRNVASFFLEGNGFGDEHLAHLKNLPKLQSLWLVNTQATDAGLERVKGLSNLTSLNVTGTQVTDTGLEHLNSLTRLRRLDLDGTCVTYTGIEELREALPNCEIPWDEPAVRSPAN